MAETYIHKPKDKTEYFKESVGTAQKYYKHPDNLYEYVKIKSKSGGGYHPPGTWFHNPDSKKPDEFIVLDETNSTAEAISGAGAGTGTREIESDKGLRDATSQFKGSVGSAQLYYKNRKNKYEHVQVFSNRVKKWYHNPYESTPDRFISMVKAIFFDVDQTLITGHTGGVYGDKSKGYTRDFPIDTLISEDKLKIIRDDLQSLQSNGYTLFINSRGNFKSVELLLLHLDLIRYFERMNILTARMPEDIREFYSIAKSYEIGMGPSSSEEWAEIKTYFIDRVFDKYNIQSKNDVWFFDDTKTNIEYAKENGYKNSFVVDNTPGSRRSLEDLIKQLFDIPASSLGGNKNRKYRKGNKKNKRPKNTRKHKNKRIKNTRKHKNKRIKNTRKHKNKRPKNTRRR